MSVIEDITPITPGLIGEDDTIVVGTAPVSRRTWSLRTSFWLVVGAQTLLLAASNFPTPLFPLYERQYGFSSGMVTVLFAVYVVALIPSMLTIGRLADRIGRRRRHRPHGRQLARLCFGAQRAVAVRR